MISHLDFSKLEDKQFKVVVPHVPYLPSDQPVKVSYSRIKDGAKVYDFLLLKSFPLDDKTYSYQEAIDVLEIFTSRWNHTDKDPWTEPYAKVVSVSEEFTFTLSEFSMSQDAAEMLQKFCKNRKRKDGLGGKLFEIEDTEEDDHDFLDR
jgi:hypothetical protein